MLLTKQQQFLIDALERTGGLRMDQMTALLRQAFCAKKPEIAQRVTEAALGQMEYRNVRLCLESGVFFLDGNKPNPRILDAVDVMIQLSGSAPVDYWRARAPILLRFCIQEQTVRHFSVAEETADLRDAEFSPLERIILLFDGQGQPRTLSVPNKQFIAVRQDNGLFRFFARGGKKKL